MADNKNQPQKNDKTDKPKATRTRRPLSERLKTMAEDKLRSRHAAAVAELKAIAAEAQRRMNKKTDLSDLASPKL